MALISIYLTFPNEEEAHRIAKHLLEAHLVACANLSQTSSIYWWEGQIVEEGEWVGVFKSSETLWEQIVERVTELHPYQVPCIVRYDIEANDSYREWVLKAVEKTNDQ